MTTSHATASALSRGATISFRVGATSSKSPLHHNRHQHHRNHQQQQKSIRQKTTIIRASSAAKTYSVKAATREVNLQKVIENLCEGKDLSEDEAFESMEALLDASENQIAAFWFCYEQKAKQAAKWPV